LNVPAWLVATPTRPAVVAVATAGPLHRRDAMKMFALLAMIVLAASAAPAPARCHPIARARLATALCYL
jgi:hypothetical protein